MATGAVSDDQPDDSSNYLRFCWYDFENDENFLRGWKQISRNFNAEKLEEEFLKAKLFYYSKEYEPVTMKGFCKWLKLNDYQQKDYFYKSDAYSETLLNEKSMVKNPSLSLEHSNMEFSKGDNSAKIANNGTKHSKGHSNTESVSSKTDTENSTDICGDNKNDSVSFAELIEMVENGLTLPGVEELNIEPTNTLPSASVIGRKKKPWEL